MVETEAAIDMMSAVTSALTQVITNVGSVITALTSSSGAFKDLLPLFAIGVAISMLMVGIKVIRGFTWGA